MTNPDPWPPWPNYEAYKAEIATLHSVGCDEAIAEAHARADSLRKRLEAWQARAEQAERELSCPSCRHPWTLHHCAEPGCRRNECHGHDGSDGPCDCKERHPFVVTVQADLDAALDLIAAWVADCDLPDPQPWQRISALLEKRRNRG